MSHSVQLETRLRQPTAVVRCCVRQSELARVVPETCGLVWNALRSAGLRGGRHIALYLDAAMNVEIGVELDAAFAGAGEVIASSTPTGDVAVTIHRGPYQTLNQANAAIRQWCAANGRTLAGPSWELYGHWQESWNSDPSQITTEVCYLLRCVMFRRYFLLFMLLTVTAALVFWFSVDEDYWWAKAEFGNGQPPLYKFQFTGIEQAIISLFMGSLIAAPLTLLSYVIQRWRR